MCAVLSIQESRARKSGNWGGIMEMREYMKPLLQIPSLRLALHHWSSHSIYHQSSPTGNARALQLPVGALEASPGKIKEGLRLISMQSSIYLRDSYLASGTRKDAIDNDLSVPSSLDVAFIVWALLHPYSRHHLPHTSTLPPSRCIVSLLTVFSRFYHVHT
ncbi:hypothetical protein EDD17DRAFT_1059186 [Pisolithus thermaeus]|nr:hypothetical protein EDD17DRAFT_1059186 [Pisolithus thermaeus]